jgi:hypothetical protein
MGEAKYVKQILIDQKGERGYNTNNTEIQYHTFRSG